MEPGSSQHAFAEQVPIESFQVPDVENDPVPFWNRALVEELRVDMVKQPVSLGAGLMQTCKQFVLDPNRVLGGEHSDLLTVVTHNPESQTIEMTERPESCSFFGQLRSYRDRFEISMPVAQDRPLTGVVCYSGRREITTLWIARRQRLFWQNFSSREAAARM